IAICTRRGKAGLRRNANPGTIRPMTEKPEITPPEDEARFAPPDVEEAPTSEEVRENNEQAESEVVEVEAISEELPPAPDVDLDAALAAISALDDMLAEQE